MATSLVGGVVGTISARSSAGIVALDVRDGTDFAIGGLGFRMAITDQRPYERATAPFRKEQFDSAPVPGDQSLSGWWTRGQMSFHEGAGTKFYEVLDGETILHTYNTNSNTITSTPGSVVLSWDTAELAVTTPVDVVSAHNPLLGETWRVILDASGGLTKQEDVEDLTATTSAALATSTGAAATSITASFHEVWYTSGTLIEAWGAAGGGTGTAVVTHGDGKTWERVWYLKGRLWAVDSDDYWFMLAANSGTPVTVTQAVDAFARTPDLFSFGDYCAQEIPDGIAVARDNRVYRIGVDTSGATPVPTALVPAATLPSDEGVASMGYLLGTLGLFTYRGVRFAQVNPDSIVYGPLVAVDVDFSKARRVDSKSSKMYAPGLDWDTFEAHLYGFDLSTMVDLVPAFSLEYDIPNVGTTGWTFGVRSAWYGLEFWSKTSGKMYRNDDPVFLPSGRGLRASGFITTGFHRFGTLEPKQFHAVKVRTGGDGGTVTVSKVMSDGSEVSLYTIPTAEGQSPDVTLGLSEPQEMLALKFTLTRDASDATKGPELLGYQLRALPAPRRQRLIRVPLMLHDIEGNSPARATGRDGDAWRRLRALEELEERGGTHVFQDFRTGEAGVCYIESVEHTGATPPGVRDSGFGGVVVLTIRKVDA